MKYATAQPFAKLDGGDSTYFFFTECPGIPAEFVFAAPTLSRLHAGSGTVVSEDGRASVRNVPPGTEVAIEFRTTAGRDVRIILLSREQAQNAWKVTLAGHEHLLITKADVFSDARSIHLRSRDVQAFSASLLPGMGEHLSATVPLRRVGTDGAFARYTATVEAKHVAVRVEQVRAAMPSSPVKMGRKFDWRPQPVAAAPDTSRFESAGIWRLNLPEGALQGLSDLFLDIDYLGDVARLYSGDRLLDDNFFDGLTWEVGLKRFSPETLSHELLLKALPLRKDAPIYLQPESWPAFEGKPEIAAVKAVTAFPEYELILSDSVAGVSRER